MKNAAAWILWLVFTLAFTLATRNPVYLVVMIASQLLLGFSLARQKNNPLWLRGNLWFLVSMVFISALVNTFFVHTGSTVLFTLPKNWILIGGIITLESLVYGAINGLVIASLYLAFNILNLALSIKQMTHLIPAAFRPIAMTVTVALTFFPSVQTRAREIKEAQLIRGNLMHRASDWAPLVIPLLVTSLEKAFLLAESMTARGFHMHKSINKRGSLLIAMVLGVFSIFSGWILQLYGYSQGISLILYCTGGLVFIAVFWLAQRAEGSTRYHSVVWTLPDILFSVLFILASIGLFSLRGNPAFSSLQYSPYPIIQVPTVQVMGIALGLITLIPAVWLSHD